MEGLDNSCLKIHFDGNGSWNIDYKNSKPSISFTICGPVKSFIEECRDYIARELKLPDNNKIYDTGNNGKCWKFIFGGNDQCFEIFQWMYKDTSIYLQRKYNKAYEHFKEIGKL